MSVGHLPSLLDLSPTAGEDLDEATVIQHFLGKSKEDVLMMLSKANNLDFYMSDLIWMGDSAFFYYSVVFEEYIRSLPEDEKDEELRSYGEFIEIRNRKRGIV